MANNTKIEWTDSTWNPIRSRRHDTGKVGWHCEKISPACDNCYAAAMNRRSDGLVGIGTGLPYAVDQRAKVETGIHDDTLLAPLRWRRPRRIFVCSMTDLFGAWITDEQIDRVFAVMALCPQHTFQVLTKRPERALGYLDSLLPFHGGRGRELPILGDHDRAAGVRLPLPNVWIGVTAENQAQANSRIPWLLRTPAVVRFVSAEPLLGPLNLRAYLANLNWVITGGESGRQARPSHPDWFRSLRDQCQAARVAFFFKQWGAWKPMTRTDGIHESPFGGQQSIRVGKKAAGRLLDGREWNEFPGGNDE